MNKLIYTALVLVSAIISTQALAASPPGAGPGGLVLTSPQITNHADAKKPGSLAWAISKAGKSRDASIALIGPHTYTIASNLTVPENITLRVPRGAVLSIKQGAALTINGGIEAGAYRVFSGQGKVAGNPLVDFVRPQWWGRDRAALQAALAFGNVNLGSDTFVVDGDLMVGSDTHISGEPGSEIICTLTGNPHNYYGLFRTPDKEQVKNVSVRGIKFTNTDAVGLYALGVMGGGESISFTNCEAVGMGLVFANNVKKIIVADSTCHTSTLDKLDLFDDHHHGIYIGGVAEDVIIRNNTVLGRRCHGIAVVSEAVFPPTSADPTREMIGKRILIQGNNVDSGTTKPTAGGIWVSCVQECRIIGNHIEDYQDVGIDFEGSRNCIADSNVLIDNNKGLALFGNCKNITFSNNSVYMTRDNEPSVGFFNTYPNGYKDIVDTRNTDIFVTGNLFDNQAKQFNEQHGTGGILVGCAKRIYFKNNVFINCFFKTHFCDDLEGIEVSNNSFTNDYRDTSYGALALAISQRNKTAKGPTVNYTITGNRFASTNDSKLSAPISIMTVGGLPGTAPWCDLNFVVRDNIVERESPGKAFEFTDNYQSDHFMDMVVTGVIKNNITNGPIALNVPKDGARKKVDIRLDGNVENAGK